MPSGRVLVTGGTGGNTPGSAIASCEVYIPDENRWVTVAAMRGRRAGHAAALLPDGRLVVSGGAEEASVGDTLRTAELFRVTGGAGWTTMPPLLGNRSNHTALSLRDGSMLLVGGRTDYLTVPHETERYNAITGRFEAASPLTTGRVSHTATVLDDGSVFVIGGRDENSSILDSAEQLKTNFP